MTPRPFGWPWRRPRPSRPPLGPSSPPGPANPKPSKPKTQESGWTWRRCLCLVRAGVVLIAAAVVALLVIADLAGVLPAGRVVAVLPVVLVVALFVPERPVRRHARAPWWAGLSPLRVEPRAVAPAGAPEPLSRGPNDRVEGYRPRGWSVVTRVVIEAVAGTVLLLVGYWLACRRAAGRLAAAVDPLAKQVQRLEAAAAQTALLARVVHPDIVPVPVQVPAVVPPGCGACVYVPELAGGGRRG